MSRLVHHIYASRATMSKSLFRCKIKIIFYPIKTEGKEKKDIDNENSNFTLIISAVKLEFFHLPINPESVFKINMIKKFTHSIKAPFLLL